MLIIGFTGLPSSGKDAACDHLVNNFGFKFLSCGDVVRAFARDVHGDHKPTRAKLQEIGQTMRVKEGPHWVLKRLVDGLPEGRYVISGVRGVKELEFLKDTFKDEFALVGVLACRKTRFRRCLARGRSGDPTTPEGFVQADMDDLKLGDGESTILSDFFVMNEKDGLDVYGREIERVLNGII